MSVAVEEVVRSCFSQRNPVLLKQLETELAENFQEDHIWMLLFSLLWSPKCKMYTVPDSKHTHTHKQKQLKNTIVPTTCTLLRFTDLFPVLNSDHVGNLYCRNILVLYGQSNGFL